MQVSKQLDIIRFSYLHYAGMELTDIESASFALVSHDTEEDPIFNYANQTALKLFEMNLAEFTKLPSRLSARQQEQSERKRLLDEVKQQGYSKNYKGIRVSSTGKLFLIEDTIVCNLLDPKTLNYSGQAALINKWTYL
jgi:hypothetical protein